MRRSLFPFLVFCGTFALAGQFAVAGAKGLDQNRKPKVSFDLYHDYLIVVHTRVGALKNLNFLLDTGATPSVIDPRVAKSLGLHTAPIPIAVLNGTAEGATATLPSLQIGPVQKENFPVLVEDLGFLAKALPVQIDGILGLDVLGQSAFTIDYAAREILFLPTELRSSVPLTLKQGLAMVNATIDHQSVELLLDTGAPSLILFRGAAVIPSEQRVSSTSIGDHDQKQVRLRSFTFGQTTFTGETAFIVPSRKDADYSFDGVISPAALGITRVAIDLPHGELAFTRDR